MAIIYGKNTAVDYAAGNLASFGKSYSRMGAAPLDMTEVWYDKAALEEYAAYRGVEQADGSYDTSSVTSYVGQRVVFVDETAKKVYNYSIQLDGSLKEIGTSPIGDGKSIAVAANGTVSLKGIGGLVFEREVDVLDENGEPTGEKKTEEVKYQPLMTKAGLTWIEPSKTTVEGLALLIEALSTDVKALETKVGKAAEGENDATGLFKAIADEAKARDDADKALDGRIDVLEGWYNGFEDQDTTYSVKEGEKILSLKNTEFSTTLKIAHTNGKIQLLGINDQVISEIDSSVFTADGVLDDASYDADTHELVFTWNIVVDQDEEGNDIYKTDRVNIADLIDTYAAGNGLSLDNNQFSVVVPTTDKYLTVDSTGVHTKGIDDAIAAAEGRAAADATEKANTAEANAKAAATVTSVDVDKHFALVDKKVTIAEGYSFLSADDAAKLAKLSIEGDDIVISANVSADNVTGLDTWITKNRGSVDGLFAQSDELKLEGIETGAEVNVIEGVQVNGTDLVVDTNRKVNIDLGAYAKQADLNTVSEQANKSIADAATAQGAANAAAQAAGENASAITGLDTRLGTAEGKINDNASAIATHATEFATLKGRVDGHDTAIEARALKTQVYTKDEANAITGTPAEGKTLVGMINDKANAADVYTKGEVNSAIKVVTDSIGEIPSNSTVMAEIAKAQAAATYDDTKVKEDIGKNATAIENITKEGGAIDVAKQTVLDAVNTLKTTEVAANTKAIADEVTRATGVEADFEERIAEIENFFSAADNKDETIENLAEIIAYIESDKTGALDMAGDIEANASAIKTINETTIPAAITTANSYTDSAIATLKIGETYETKEDAGKKLQAAKDYTNAQIPAALAAYKVKDVDDVSLQLSETGVASVKAVSTDLLVQGTLELVLNGGSAN